MNEQIWNEDCIAGAAKHIASESVNLLINDPPFGIQESSFGKYYKRRDDFVIKGYKEAPTDYYPFTLEWMAEAYRVLKPNGSMYVFSGWSNLKDVLNALEAVGFVVINHIIWKYNFGVNTKHKYVTSHYHVLYVKKSKDAVPTFNTFCRFGCQEKAENGKGSLNFQDIEDVFRHDLVADCDDPDNFPLPYDLSDVMIINKDYLHAQKKNSNKLPDDLIMKLIQYSSNEGDVVGDFFMGNFTTAIMAKALGRNVVGFEFNEEGYTYHMERLSKIEFGLGLKSLKVVDNKPPTNQGKPVTDQERDAIWEDYKKAIDGGAKKKDATKKLEEDYGRGRFSIKNIIDKCLVLYNGSKHYEGKK